LWNGYLIQPVSINDFKPFGGPLFTTAGTDFNFIHHYYFTGLFPIFHPNISTSRVSILPLKGNPTERILLFSKQLYPRGIVRTTIKILEKDPGI
jgi:hypothetical protein